MSVAQPWDTTFDGELGPLWAAAEWRRACPVTAAYVAQESRQRSGPLREAFEKYDTVLLPWVGAHFRAAPVRVGVYLREYPFPTLRSPDEKVLDGDRGGHVPTDVMRQAFWASRDRLYSPAYRNTVGETLDHLPRVLAAMSSYASMRGHRAFDVTGRPAVLDHLVIGDWVKLFAPFHQMDKPGRSSWHHREMYAFASDRFMTEIELLGLDWVVLLGPADTRLERRLRAWLAAAAHRQAVVLPHPARYQLRAAVTELKVDADGLVHRRRASLHAEEVNAAPAIDADPGQTGMLNALKACLERARQCVATVKDTRHYRGLVWSDQRGRDYLDVAVRGKVVAKLVDATYPGASERLLRAGWTVWMQDDRLFCLDFATSTPESRLDDFASLLRGL